MFCCCESKISSNKIGPTYRESYANKSAGNTVAATQCFSFLSPPVSKGDLREIKEGFNGAQRFNYAAEMELAVFSPKRGLIYDSSQMSRCDDFSVTSAHKCALFKRLLSVFLSVFVAQRCSPDQDNNLRQ